MERGTGKRVGREKREEKRRKVRRE